MADMPTYPLDTRDYSKPYRPEVIPPLATSPYPYALPASQGPLNENETPPYRHKDFAAEGTPLIVTPHTDPSVSTTFHILLRAKDKWPDRHSLGSRAVKGVHEETKPNGKKWTTWELGDYDYMTFRDVYDEVRIFGSAFREAGVVKGDKVGIYMQTCAKWLLTSLSAHSQSLTIVTAYDTLGTSALTHSLNSTKARVLVTEGRLLHTLIPVLSSTPEVTTVVYQADYGLPDAATLEKLQSDSPNTRILSWDAFRLLGSSVVPPHPFVPPTAELDACIMYTSGSTGTPKGVCLSHQNVVATVASAHYTLAKFLTPQDRLLAYLPLAHIVEFVFEHTAMYWGAALGYGRPQTLTPAGGSLSGPNGSKDDPSIKGDIECFAPTIMVGVPAVWETVKKGIVNKVNAAGLIKKNIFYSALQLRQWGYNTGGEALPGPLGRIAINTADTVVFNGIRKLLGGNLRAALSGAAKLNPETASFLTHVLGAPIVKGYALTESTGMLSLMVPDQWDSFSDGCMGPAVEVKLVSYPEAGYSVHDKPNPRGEVWVRGSSVSRGYYSGEEANAWVEDERGVWFTTGDIGEFELVPRKAGDDDTEWRGLRRFRIIDRKKNLVKTSKGEYIALEKLEAFYRSPPVVWNICVMATSAQPSAIAIVHPVPAQLRLLIANTMPGKDSTADYEVLIHDPEVRKKVLEVLLEAGRKGGLNRAEMLASVVLVGPEGEEWSPETGLLTSARKIERRKVSERWREEIEAAFNEQSGSD
ncbi:long-chain-fatty-acid-CoA ligase 1 [Peziza echinospora]|nr:long-chain-fatty-acid-CoA ligase 1 [Peziza echinospora]